MTWQRLPQGHTFGRGVPGRSLSVAASMVPVIPTCYHWHRRPPGTSRWNLTICHKPPYGTPLSWPARFWWHYSPPRWIALGRLGWPQLYPLWQRRPVRGSHSILAPLSGSPRMSPRVHTGKGPRRIPPVLWGGFLVPQFHRSFLGLLRTGIWVTVT